MQPSVSYVQVIDDFTDIVLFCILQNHVYVIVKHISPRVVLKDPRECQAMARVPELKQVCSAKNLGPNSKTDCEKY